MHKKEVMIGLRVSRKKSGLSQEDIAHLLDTTQPRVSRLEAGQAALTIAELCKLVIIYNQDTSKIFYLLHAKMLDEVNQCLARMSGDIDISSPMAELRQTNLNELTNRLSVFTLDQHAA